MREYVPVYYPRFRCTASACRHTCCAGWEIDIDGETAALYASVPGSFGEELRRSMALADGEARFLMTGNGRCPFLDDTGLCRIYTRLGEEALCQICRDHPRYRNGFSSWVEEGLGMCCEEAARVILTETEKARLIPREGTAGPRPKGRREKAFLAFRDRVLAVLWDRAIPLEARLSSLEAAGLCPFVGPAAAWRERLLCLEALEKDWRGLLEERLGAERPLPGGWDLPLEQAAVYFVTRHLPGALEDGALQARCGLAVLLSRVLCALLAGEDRPSLERLTDLCRRLSTEIEYSDENVPALLEALGGEEG